MCVASPRTSTSHLHVLISDGAFAKDGTFIPLPEKHDTAPFLKLWENKIFDFLLAEGKITAEVVEQIQSWRFSGFSADHSVRMETGDTKGIERLALDERTDDPVARRRFLFWTWTFGAFLQEAGD